MELDPATLRVGQRVRVVSGFGGQVVGTIVLIEETMNGMREVTLDNNVTVLAGAPGDPNPLNRFFQERAVTPPRRKPVRARETPGRKLNQGASRKKTRRRRVVRRLVRA
jgi:hypothetical protein